MTEQEYIRYRELMNKPMALLTDSDLFELRELGTKYEETTESNNTAWVDSHPLGP